jgi:hypothetical protein
MKDYYANKRLKRLLEIELDIYLDSLIESREIPEKLLKLITK